MDEQDWLKDRARWYFREQLSFDKKLIRLRYRTIRPWFTGHSCLELGPADGVMTELLLADFEQVTVVDAAQALLDAIPGHPRLRKVCCLFETYETSEHFDVVVMDHVLEHVQEPKRFLRRAASWAALGGRLVVGVPNAHSIHRLAAVRMGLLSAPADLNDRDRALGHRRVYTPVALRDELESAKLLLIHQGGVFFKPLPTSQIDMHWTDEMIEGFYQLGFDFPEHAADIFAVCTCDAGG